MAFKTASQRDTWAEVRLDCIKYNVTETKKHIGAEVCLMAMVKGDGYGHGAVETAKVAIEAGAECLGVALMDEAMELREAGIEVPILVLGRTNPEDIPIAVELGIELSVFQKEWLKEAQVTLKRLSSPLSIHIKADTGMGRFGLTEPEELEEFMDVLETCTSIQVKGLYTHFATADSKDTSFLKKQYDSFLTKVDQVTARFGEIPYIHCGNSAASLRFPDQCFNMIRLGIAMYGLPPSEEIVDEFPFELQPAFSLHSRIAQVKKVPEGSNIGYGRTYVTEQEEWIATVPIGYADGWFRFHSSSAVLVEGRRVPIIGRVCMDQCMIRLPHYTPVGTKVTLIGKQNKEEISAVEVARRLETIPYEIPCMISKRVPRIYFK